MRRRLASLSPAELEDLASAKDSVVMKPVYDTEFEPWEESRLVAAIERLQKIALSAASKEATQREAAGDAELEQMRVTYKLLYERVSSPEIARNVNLMNCIWFMVRTFARMKANEIGETEAKALASDRALTELLKQGRAQEK